MLNPEVAAYLVSIKSMPALTPELDYARKNMKAEDFHLFMHELRRLTTLMFDYYQYDLNPEELYELVHQRNGSLPQN